MNDASESSAGSASNQHHRASRSYTAAASSGAGASSARGAASAKSTAQGKPEEHFPGYWGRRIGAIFIDWALSTAISAGFFGLDQTATLIIFAIMTFVLVGTAGTTIGHLICGVGMRTLAGGFPGPLRALARTIGVCLVLPVVITDPAGRSLHDRWSGTQVVKLR